MEQQPWGSDPTPEPISSSVVPPWDTVAAPTAPALKKKRGLAATIGILIFLVIAIAAFKLLVHTAAVAVVSTLPGCSMRRLHVKCQQQGAPTSSGQASLAGSS
jgi:hypothetical protein